MDARSQRRWARLASTRVRAHRRVGRRYTGARHGTCPFELWLEAMELLLNLEQAQKRQRDDAS